MKHSVHDQGPAVVGVDDDEEEPHDEEGQADAGRAVPAREEGL